VTRFYLPACCLLFAFHFCHAQSNTVFQKGVIYKKQGDSLQCFVEMAVTFGKEIAYKQSEKGPNFSIKSEDVRAIKTEHKYIENIAIDNKERLMALQVDGSVKLFMHVVINPGEKKKGNGGTYSFNNEPTIIYFVRKDTSDQEITKKNFKPALAELLSDQPTIATGIRKDSYELKDIEAIIKEYNNLTLIKRLSRKVTGRVLDSETKKGVKDATVIIYGPDIKTTTNALGYFQLDVLPWDTLGIQHGEYEHIAMIPPEANSFIVPLKRVSQEKLDSMKKGLESTEWMQFADHMRKNLRFPASGRRMGLQGSVLVYFFLDNNGNVTNTKIVKDIGEYGKEVALRIKETPAAVTRLLQQRFGSQAFVLPVFFCFEKEKTFDYPIPKEGGVLLNPIVVTVIGIKREVRH
jgi:hypothetical protein